MEKSLTGDQRTVSGMITLPKVAQPGNPSYSRNAHSYKPACRAGHAYTHQFDSSISVAHNSICQRVEDFKLKMLCTVYDHCRLLTTDPQTIRKSLLGAIGASPSSGFLYLCPSFVTPGQMIWPQQKLLPLMPPTLLQCVAHPKDTGGELWTRV